MEHEAQNQDKESSFGSLLASNNLLQSEVLLKLVRKLSQLCSIYAENETKYSESSASTIFMRIYKIPLCLSRLS